MSNIYLNQFKDVLEAHYTKQKISNKKIGENIKKYSPEYAEKENKVVRAEQKMDFEEAIALITKTYKTVRGLLACASFVNVEDLTADRLIFESGIDLSPQDVRAYLERYADNFTMKRLIASWIKKQPKPEQYDMINFSLPSDQLKVYKQFGEKAIYVSKKIFMNKEIMIDPIEIRSFDDSIMNADKLAIIGTGAELAGYDKKRIPDAQRHIFDAIELTPSLVQGAETMSYWSANSTQHV